MNIITHTLEGLKVAEVTADNQIIRTAEDGLDLLGNIYYEGFDKVILRAQNISPEFFDLKSGMAGEILQKFSNYRIRLVIVGEFGDVQSKSLRDFIYECNSGKQVNFVETLEIALERISG